MDVAVAKLSKFVESKIAKDDDAVAGDGDYDQEIQFPDIKAAVLAKVIEYCEHYHMEEMTAISRPYTSSKVEDLVQPYYAEFVKLELTVLFELVTASIFMDIKPLLDLTNLATSIMTEGYSAEDWKIYCQNCVNSLVGTTTKEEAAVQEENKLAEQPPPSPPPSST